MLISGGGTTLKNLIQYDQQGRLDAKIALVLSSNPDAQGLNFAIEAGIPSSVVNHKQFDDVESFSSAIFDSIRDSRVDLVVMGGFLRRLKIPHDFEYRVINIHPSLIPSFCGKGNYGLRVHRGVIEYGCKISGCTVHFVDDQYDHGPIIAQATAPVMSDDTPEELAGRVFDKECELYPRVINAIASGNISIDGRRINVSFDESI